MAVEDLWSRGSGRLAWLLAAVTGPPLFILVWLGVLLVGDDAKRTAERVRAERDLAARTMVQSLDRSLRDLERHLDDAGPLAAGLVRLTATPRGVTAEPADALLWVPSVNADANPGGDGPRVFFAGERAEYAGDVRRALSTYDALLHSADPTVQAGALMRLARIHVKARRWDDAVRCYRQLAEIPDVIVAGAPASLQARRRIAVVLERAGRTDELAREATGLRSDLEAGRWALDWEAWEQTAADVERWTSAPVPRDPRRLLISQVAARLWDASTVRSLDTSARAVFDVGGVMVTTLSRDSRDGPRALLMPPPLLDAMREAAAREAAGLTTASVALVGPPSPLASGVGNHRGPDALVMEPKDTGLPWTMVLGPEDAAAIEARDSRRRWLLLGGFATVLVFVGGAGAFLWRLVRREAAISRLQREFVAAVSHEFRTPLTSLRLAWEVLDDQRDAPADERRSLYGSIGRNSERLQRLVESLLDFSRMESGRRPYDLTPIDAGALARDVVAEFQQQHPERAADVHVMVPAGAAAIVPADRAALAHALWNLLDNAVKYSPDCGRVTVTVDRTADAVRIVVSDEGIGVPRAEQASIFGRFVRGDRARLLGVGGTGLGLAMVAHIVEAHRGLVTVSSDGERGSTFTIVLPHGDAGNAPASASVLAQDGRWRAS